ncbi:hypothetical protein HETIRDRAFT_449601 [Heterobasidion irregulare TC 32-1]|uniref:RING-type domain-containing protein n=1 Tax=Heterobasidion irregulare (strain TC 32-1) TaxID=747525 RepID=W4KDT5_HETIT|nr:uncharacterized protein HETIRDRAFT_449601 [Heterobasidion irregulare TC 32-1]ETW84012.1 hypothetical protein HETIRDRAFT_449601 [Heterobasidion irregulare TC 32-1]
MSSPPSSLNFMFEEPSRTSELFPRLLENAYSASNDHSFKPVFIDMEPEDLPWLSAGQGMMNMGMSTNSSLNYQQLTRDLLTVMQPRASSRQIRELVESLPKLSEEEMDILGQHESSCPICMNTFLASLAEEELALVMDSPAHPVEDLGVTRLSKTCGHFFCRKELSINDPIDLLHPHRIIPILTWIRDGHPSCPLCRTPFIKLTERDASVLATSADRDSNNDEPRFDDDAPDDDDAYDQAMERIVAAYREERRRLRAGPAFFWPTQPEGQEGATGDHEHDDRHEFAGMYS